MADDSWPAAVISSPALTHPEYGWREIWAGIDAARDQWLAYSGMTVALRSPDIYSDGWRLRVGGGYGRYAYDRDVVDNPGCGTFPALACTYSSRHFDVEHSYGEALIGYHLQLGELTAKAFVGAAVSSQRHLKADPSDKSDGTEFGAKGALELWLNLGDDTWTSLDVSYSTARNETSSRWRTGWRLAPAFSIGPELRYDRNVQSAEGEWNGRAGLFARYDWGGGEVSLAAGAMGRVDGDWSANDLSPYATLNVLYQY